MIKIFQPSIGEILNLSERNNQYYWSAGAELLLEIYQSSSTDKRQKKILDSQIVLRDSNQQLSENNFTIYEGPLSENQIFNLGLKYRLLKTNEIEISSPITGFIEKLSYKQILVRAIPQKFSKNISEPYKLECRGSRFENYSITLQIFEDWSKEFSPLFVTEFNSGPAVVGLVSNSKVVLGFPLFDIGVQNLTLPPLKDGYFQTIAACKIDDLLMHIEKNMKTRKPSNTYDNSLQHPDKGEDSVSRLTIRHDLDRPVSDERIDYLLENYISMQYKSTWFIQANLIPNNGQIKKIVDGGHEIGLHTCASNEKDFKSEIQKIQDSCGVKIKGFTAHGGHGSAGHLGSRQNIWALESDLLYGEILGAINNNPIPFIRIEGGIPAITKLIIHSSHFSFDKSTKVDDHNKLELPAPVVEKLNRGHQVIIMNHPDIHSESLIKFLSELKIHNFRSETLAETCNIFTRKRHNILKQS